MPNTGPVPNPNDAPRPITPAPQNLLNGNNADFLNWLNSLPTTDPGVPGQYWINGGVLCVSQP